MHRPTSKSELRKALRERRREVAHDLRTGAAVAVAGYLEQLGLSLPGARIALYLPADGEIDTGELAQQCRRQGSELYLPVVGSGGVMQFALWERDAVLQVNRYGIPEPGPEYPLRDASELNLVFLPLVGWDPYGTRLGMGGGFYDRALAGEAGPLRVGLGFECQKVDRLQADDWDIPMDYVATEAALHRCGASG